MTDQNQSLDLTRPKTTPEKNDAFLALFNESVLRRQPIIQLDEGDRVILVVDEIRQITGPHGDGDILDCRTLNDTVFSLRGHALLVAKVKASWSDTVPLFLIERLGVIGKTIDYYVASFPGDPLEIGRNKMGVELIESTELLIQRKIEELPPRD